MRRFFRAQRDEDYSQIQYLTAKCNRLAHDKAVLDREFLLSVDREKKLHNDLDVVAARLLHQEQTNMELRMKQNQLISRIQQQQDLVDLLQQRWILLAEESSRDTQVLQQVASELLCLQSSELKLEGLVEELHAEAQHRVAVAESLHAELRAEARRGAAVTESLQMELRSKTVELEQLQVVNKTLREELKDLRKAHQKEVRDLQQVNEGSVKKLQETAEQFEWLCQQQRYWMCCVRRFKDCLMEERKTLLQQLSQLDLKAEDLKAENLKAEDLKAEDLKAEDLKAEDLKAEDLKAEDLKAEDLKAEDLKAEDLKAEDLKAEDLKAEDLKAEDLKAGSRHSQRLQTPDHRDE